MIPDERDQINRPEKPGCGEHVTWMARHESLSGAVHALLHRIEELEERVNILESVDSDSDR